MKKIQLDHAGMFILFLKRFDTAKQCILGIGNIHVPRASKVSDLIPVINEKMKWAPETSLKLYEVGNGAFSPT